MFASLITRDFIYYDVNYYKVWCLTQESLATRHAASEGVSESVLNLW